MVAMGRPDFWEHRQIWRVVHDLLQSASGIHHWGVEPRRHWLGREQPWLCVHCASSGDSERLYDQLLALGCRRVRFRDPCSLWVMPSLE
jgi:hypothetical protein